MYSGRTVDGRDGENFCDEPVLARVQGARVTPSVYSALLVLIDGSCLIGSNLIAIAEPKPKTMIKST